MEGEAISIPVGDGFYRGHARVQGHGHYSEYRGITRAEEEEGRPLFFTCETDWELDYGILAEALEPSETPPDGFIRYCYFVVTYVDGAYGYAVLEENSTKTVKAEDVILIFRMAQGGVADPMGGSSTTATNTSFTGSGVLGGSGAGSVSGGTKRLAVTGTRGSSDETEEESADDPSTEQKTGDIRVWTEKVPGEGCFELHFESSGKAVARLAARVSVRMTYMPAAGMEAKPLYAVFRNSDGTLTAFEASYDPVLGIVRFRSDIAGRFVIVAFEFEGEPFTEAFYEALAELDAVKAL